MTDCPWLHILSNLCIATGNPLSGTIWPAPQKHSLYISLLSPSFYSGSACQSLIHTPTFLTASVCVAGDAALLTVASSSGKLSAKELPASTSSAAALKSCDCRSAPVLNSYITIRTMYVPSPCLSSFLRCLSTSLLCCEMKWLSWKEMPTDPEGPPNTPVPKTISCLLHGRISISDTA